MKYTPSFRRAAVAASFVAAAALMVCSVVLQPEFTDSHADRLAAIDEAGAAATVSALTFALAQLPFLLAMLGAAHLLRRRAPVLAALVAIFGTLGGFGHAVYGGVSVVMIGMAADEANRAAHAAVLTAGESGVGLPFMIMGTLGTVLGLLMLTIGVARGKVGPRWLPFALGGFLVVEFVGTNFVAWAGPLAGVLYLVAFVALAVVAARSSIDDWSAVSDDRPDSPAAGAASHRAQVALP